MRSDSTNAGLPYRGRRYRLWWRGYSGRVRKYCWPVCWDGKRWYTTERPDRHREARGVRIYLAPAIQVGVVGWKFAAKKKEPTR